MSKGYIGQEKERSAQFNEQIDRTTEAHKVYSRELDELKNLFLDNYDRATIIGLITLIQDIGHGVDRRQAKDFKKQYISGNFDDTSIIWFKSSYARYNKELIDFLNDDGNQLPDWPDREEEE